jgi:hypothetical protein
MRTRSRLTRMVEHVCVCIAHMVIGWVGGKVLLPNKHPCILSVILCVCCLYHDSRPGIGTREHTSWFVGPDLNEHVMHPCLKGLN